MADRDRDVDLAREVGRKARRRLRARSDDSASVWLGLGSFGIVGWSVAIPALVGTATGLWLDGLLDDRVSWTLMGLFAGVSVGCLIAWLWVRRAARGDPQ